MGPPRPLPPILLDGLQMKSLSREHSLVAWGIARWRQELEFTMATTKQEPHPEWEREVTGGADYRENLCSVGVREQSWDRWKVLGKITGHRVMEVI